MVSCVGILCCFAFSAVSDEEACECKVAHTSHGVFACIHFESKRNPVDELKIVYVRAKYQTASSVPL